MNYSKHVIKGHCKGCSYYKDELGKPLCHNLFTEDFFISDNVIMQCDNNNLKHVVKQHEFKWDDKEYTIDINDEAVNKLRGTYGVIGAPVLGTKIHMGIDLARKNRDHRAYTWCDYPQIVPLSATSAMADMIKDLTNNLYSTAITNAQVHGSKDESLDGLFLALHNVIRPLSQQAIALHCYKCEQFRHSDNFHYEHICNNLRINTWYITKDTIKECKAKDCKVIKHDTLSSLWYDLIKTLVIKEEKQTMTTEQTIKVLEAMKAGKKILGSPNGKTWTEVKYDVNNPLINTFDCVYKVAPEYRPYKGEELRELLCSRIRLKDDKGFQSIITGIDIGTNKLCLGYTWRTSQDLFDKFEYTHGVPFGVEIK